MPSLQLPDGIDPSHVAEHLSSLLADGESLEGAYSVKLEELGYGLAGSAALVLTSHRLFELGRDSRQPRTISSYHAIPYREIAELGVHPDRSGEKPYGVLSVVLRGLKGKSRSYRFPSIEDANEVFRQLSTRSLTAC